MVVVIVVYLRLCLNHQSANEEHTPATPAFILKVGHLKHLLVGIIMLVGKYLYQYVTIAITQFGVKFLLACVVILVPSKAWR